MRRLVPIGLAVMLAVLVLAGFARSWESAAFQDQRAAALTKRLKTYCVGRFLIDMPEEAQVDLGRVRIHGFNISAFTETLEEFQKRLADREAQIKTKSDRLGGNANLESDTAVKSDSGLVGKIFVHSRTVTEGTSSNGLEIAHYRYEGVAVEALVHGAGVSIDLSADDYDPARIGNLPKLVAQLVPNPDNTIPTERGFCFDHAYFRDPLTADQGETLTMFAGLPSHPDVQFLLILSAGTKPDEQGLLERSEAAGERFSLRERMRISQVRAAPRKIGALLGDELVKSFDEENDAHVHSFWWEVNGTEDDVLIPHFVFKMDTGKSNTGPVPSSLSERAAIGLWDRIMSSIRLRTSAQAYRGAD